MFSSFNYSLHLYYSKLFGTTLLSAVAYGKYIFVFGGYNGIEQKHYGDVYRLDTGNIRLPVFWHKHRSYQTV